MIYSLNDKYIEVHRIHIPIGFVLPYCTFRIKQKILRRKENNFYLYANILTDYLNSTKYIQN